MQISRTDKILAPDKIAAHSRETRGKESLDSPFSQLKPSHNGQHLQLESSPSNRSVGHGSGLIPETQSCVGHSTGQRGQDHPIREGSTNVTAKGNPSNRRVGSGYYSKEMGQSNRHSERHRPHSASTFASRLDSSPSPTPSVGHVHHLEGQMGIGGEHSGMGYLGRTDFATDQYCPPPQSIPEQNLHVGTHEDDPPSTLTRGSTVLNEGSLHPDPTPVLLSRGQHVDQESTDGHCPVEPTTRQMGHEFFQ
ncbi:hypothetical protein SLA2020_046590 [Shorea laevis]